MYKHQQKRLKNAYNEINIWANYIKHTDTIFDIGTNVGLYTIVFSKKFPNSKIHSFDPMVSLVEDMWNDNIKNTIHYLLISQSNPICRHDSVYQITLHK